MSTQQQPAAMNAQDAEALLLNNVYVPVLLNKVAEAGIVPQNDQDVLAIVKMASQLRALHDQQQLNVVTGVSNRLQKAAGHLDTLLSGKPAVENDTDRLVKAAAKEAASVPEYAAAARALAQLTA